MQFIQELTLTYKLRRSSSSKTFGEYDMVHLPNVRIFNLNLGSAYERMPLPRIIFELKQLKSFSLEGDFFYSEAFFNFIKRHPKITSLCLKNTFMHDYLDKYQLMSALPALEELAIIPSNEVSMSIHFIINYLRNFDSVNRCMFYCMDSESDVFECCGTKWNAQITQHNRLSTLVKLTRAH